VIVYKFLSCGAVGPFSGFRWPTPAAGAPGAWVAAAREGAAYGVHACRASDLPYWMDDELWIAELEGEVRATEHQVVAPRARLVAPVAGWPELARALGDDCAAALRARVDAALAGGGLAPDVAEQLRGYVADAEACARGGNPAAAAYVAARASAVLAGDQAGFTGERRRQAEWLQQRLGSAPGSAPPLRA
jgi:hypothetical protein